MSRLYDPNDAFSLLNPYSAPNMLMKSSAAVYERHRQSVAESVRYVERIQSAGRSQAPAFYPRYTVDKAPVVTGWVPTETKTRTSGALESWVAFLIVAVATMAVFYLT